LRPFHKELVGLQRQLLDMANLVVLAIQGSVSALVERDEQQAQQVIRNESHINEMEIAIDDHAIRLLALHQPMAGDLRFLTAAIKINTGLERMGDLAINVVERALSLLSRPPLESPVDIPRMAELVESMVHKSLEAFVMRDGVLARSVLVADDAVDGMKDGIYKAVVEVMQADPLTIAAGVDLMFVAHNLERIADHATNIAENVLYLTQGIDVRHHAEAGKKNA
jgi:phosphate transport system protein